MRRILVDHARARHAQKRGGGMAVVSLDELSTSPGESGHSGEDLTPTALHHHDGDRHEDIVAIDRALADLAALDPQQAKVVEMRYFAGLTIDETADALGISPATVKREWAMARAWLRRELEQDR
jgi:RNA polymerase sigma factor (TIGR02999 family)